MSKIKIGIVGLNFGKHIIKEIVEGPGREWLELAAVCDIEQAKAREHAQKHGVKAYFDIDALLADRDIPAIGLFTGPVGRADLIRRIVRAGKDVMTTKPFELDPAAGLAVLKEARGMGRVVHMNSPGPLLPPDLLQVNAWRAQHQLGRPVGCRLDVWVSYREKPDGSWYDDPEKCPAAPVFRLGIYLINDLVRLFGDATQVQILQSRIFTGRPTVDNAQLGILFRDGTIANIFASFCVKDGDFYRNSMVLNFENGTIYRNCGPARHTGAGVHTELALIMADAENKRQLIAEAQVASGSGEYQWQAFHRAVRGEQFADEVTPEQVAAGLRVIQAMSRAIKAGGVAKVEG